MTEETVTAFGRRDADQRLPERIGELERLLGGVSVPGLVGRFEGQEVLVTECRSRLDRVSDRTQKAVEFAARPQDALEAVAKRAEELLGATLVATAKSDQLHEGTLAEVAAIRRDNHRAMKLVGQALAIRGGTLVGIYAISLLLAGILTVQIYDRVVERAEAHAAPLDLGRRG